MKRIVLFALAAAFMLSWFPSYPAHAEERPVLTIGDVHDRSSARMDGENQLGLWKYLEDQLGPICGSSRKTARTRKRR